jgi:hypothetical protein
MRLYQRVLSLHPAAITIGFILLFVVGGVVIAGTPFGPASFVTFSISMFVLMAPVMLWHYSLYRVASDRGEAILGHRGGRAFFFGLAGIGIGAYLVAFPFWFSSEIGSSTYGNLGVATPLLLAIGNISYFAAVWAAANALTRFDDQTKSAEFHKTLGTFILELYLPIGIWVIYPRIRRLLEASSPVA